MDAEQQDDIILAGDDFTATDYDEDDAILGETQQAEPAPQPEPAEEAAPVIPNQQTQQAEPQQDDRQAYAWSEMNRKLRETQAELDRIQREREAAQQQVDTGLLGDEELGYINQQLGQRDAYWQSQITQMQTQFSIQQAAMQADMNREQTGGWDHTLELARQEATRQAPILGVTPEQLFAVIDGTPDAGQRITALAQMARERVAAQQPVDTKQIEAAAYARAMNDLQKRSAASPHNLAPPGIGSIPAVSVTPTKAMTDDEILSQ